MTVVASRAAQYVRMSTEHQQYSTENQADVIADYARKRSLEVVATFTDAGKSGLRIDGRDGLRSLIRVVEEGKADFANILVYDVSRWGRFQDADESAYYEYICRRAGITVHYCAEQFENDGSPVSTIVKGVKRAMAGEYSRELSAKVFKGQSKLIELGFRQGGTAGFGLRRQLVDQVGQPKQQLGLREQKSLQTDRVILVPGPAEEIAVVHRIYRQFIDERCQESQIADVLNRQGVRNGVGGEWTRGTVHEVLTNEKYIGRNVYNRVSFKLKKRRVSNAAKAYFNDPRVTGGSRQDASWFHTRARAVDALLDQIEAHVAKAQTDDRLSLDGVPDVARELVDIVVANLSRIDLALEVLPELPTDFSDAPRRIAGMNNAVSSVVSKVGSGEAVAPIAVFESIMRGLGHPNPTNLTSLARKSRESK